jgi:hypothetical protein
MNLKGSLARAVALALVIVGCSSPASSAGQAVVDRIRGANHPVVERVEYRAESADDPAEIRVLVRSGTTDDQANEFWCDVVEPAGGSDARVPGTFPVTVWDSTGETQLVVEPDCEDQPV